MKEIHLHVHNLTGDACQIHLYLGGEIPRSDIPPSQLPPVSPPPASLREGVKAIAQPPNPMPPAPAFLNQKSLLERLGMKTVSPTMQRLRFNREGFEDFCEKKDPDGLRWRPILAFTRPYYCVGEVPEELRGKLIERAENLGIVNIPDNIKLSDLEKLIVDGDIEDVDEYEDEDFADYGDDEDVGDDGGSGDLDLEYP